MFKRFRILIYAYLFFIGLWWIAKYLQPQLTPVLENADGHNLGNGFYTSWLASLSEDIIFFGIIGFLGLILSTKLPQDENYDIRVDSIANGRKVGDKARKFLNASIKKLLVYNDTYNIKIIIRKIDRQHNLAEVYAEYCNVCTNMCRDVIYPLYTNAFVMPTHENQGDLGYVSYLDIHEEGNPSNKNTIIEGEIHKLTTKGFNQPIAFNVPANGAAIWKFCYCIWQSINGNKQDLNDWYFVKTSGFAENLNIKLVNKTEFDIEYAFHFKNRASLTEEYIKQDGEIIKGKTSDEDVVKMLIHNAVAHSDDKFELFFQVK